MIGRRPDLAWEALVRETGANPHVERGELNAALKAIRMACHDEGIEEDVIPDEIARRAERYQLAFPGLTMTATALARHWFRVMGSQGESGKNLFTRWEEKFGDRGRG